MSDPLGDDPGMIPADAERLTAFLGNWKVTGTLVAGDDPATVSGTWRYTGAADGWGVYGELMTEIEGMGAFEERELIGFDPAERKVHLFSMNRYAVRDHVGGWESDTKLSVTYSGTVEGQEIREVIVLDFAGPGEIKGQVAESSDGKLAITTDLTLTRID